MGRGPFKSLRGFLAQPIEERTIRRYSVFFDQPK